MTNFRSSGHFISIPIKTNLSSEFCTHAECVIHQYNVNRACTGVSMCVHTCRCETNTKLFAFIKFHVYLYSMYERVYSFNIFVLLLVCMGSILHSSYYFFLASQRSARVVVCLVRTTFNHRSVHSRVCLKTFYANK